MIDLTEQWKKGLLPSGYYYVKNEFGNIFPSDYSEDYDNIGDTVIKDFFTEVSEIKEVLEPVPSYEQWQKHRKTLLKTQEKNCDLEIINAQLKELLKECRDEYADIHRCLMGTEPEELLLIQQIDEVL